jgi:vacuolar-type H+-ATPase subunit H
MVKRNEFYKHKNDLKEFKQQYKDRLLINNQDIEKQNIINRALLDANRLIDNRLSKGRVITDEEKDEIRKQIENDFLEMFKTICIQKSKNKIKLFGNFQT